MITDLKYLESQFSESAASEIGILTALTEEDKQFNAGDMTIGDKILEFFTNIIYKIQQLITVVTSPLKKYKKIYQANKDAIERILSTIDLRETFGIDCNVQVWFLYESLNINKNTQRVESYSRRNTPGDGLDFLEKHIQIMAQIENKFNETKEVMEMVDKYSVTQVYLNDMEPAEVGEYLKSAAELQPTILNKFFDAVKKERQKYIAVYKNRNSIDPDTRENFTYFKMRFEIFATLFTWARCIYASSIKSALDITKALLGVKQESSMFDSEFQELNEYCLLESRANVLQNIGKFMLKQKQDREKAKKAKAMLMVHQSKSKKSKFSKLDKEGEFGSLSGSKTSTGSIYDDYDYDCYDETPAQKKAYEAYVTDLFKAVTSKLKAALNKYPKIKDMYVVLTKKEALDKSEYGKYIPVVEYDIMLHPDVESDKVFKRDLYRNAEYQDACGALEDEIQQIITDAGFGKCEYGGDWDDGPYEIKINDAKFKTYLAKFEKNDITKNESTEEGYINTVCAKVYNEAVLLEYSISINEGVIDGAKKTIALIKTIIRQMIQEIKVFISKLTTGISKLEFVYKMLDKKLNKVKIDESKIGNLVIVRYVMGEHSLKTMIQDLARCLPDRAGVELFRDDYNFLDTYKNIRESDIIHSYDSIYGTKTSNDPDTSSETLNGLNYAISSNIELMNKMNRDMIDCKPILDQMMNFNIDEYSGSTLGEAINNVYEACKIASRISGLYSSAIKKMVQSTAADIKKINEAINQAIVKESYVNSFDLAHYMLKEQSLQENLVRSSKDTYYNKDKWDSGEVNICFIVGLSGSGKSTMGSAMSKNAKSIEHYDMDDIIFNKQNHDMEWYKSKGDMAYKFFMSQGSKYFMTFKELKESKMNEGKYRRDITNDFVKFAISYANSHKGQKFIIEGVWLYRYISPSMVSNYAVCIKGTSAITSMYRAGKRDNDYLDKIKKTGKLAFRDDALLNKWRKAFASDDSSSEDDEKKLEPIAASANIIPSQYDNGFIYLAAYDEYMESVIENERRLHATLTECGLQEGVLLEGKLQDDIKARWERFVNFAGRLFDRFQVNMEKILFNNKAYLEKYKDIILNVKWSDDTFSYNGNYKTAVERLQYAVPLYDYANHAKFLRQDGYEAILTHIMAGKNFKYANTNTNLGAQFRDYFLALDQGTTNGKLSDFAPKELFDFCYNYSTMLDSVKKDQDTLKKSLNTILTGINKEMQEKGENPNGGNPQPTNPGTNTAGANQSNNPQQNTNTNGGQNTGGSTQESFWINLSEADDNTQNNNNGNADNNNNSGNNDQSKGGDTQLTVNSNQPQTADKNGNTNDTSQQAKNQKNNTTEQDVNNIVNKWTNICRGIITGKFTALQKISKDYMYLIRFHVKAHGGKDEKQENPKENGKNENNNNGDQQQPQQNQNQNTDQNKK